MNAKLTAERLRRRAIVYIRQSSPSQVVHNQESQRRQYALVDRARELGFSDIITIDDDLGRSGSGLIERPGFQRLVAEVCTGDVGAVSCLEASRLARNGRDWHHLIELCGMVGAVVIDPDGIYDPVLMNDRLLLGLKRHHERIRVESPSAAIPGSHSTESQSGRAAPAVARRIVLDLEPPNRARSRSASAAGDSVGLHKDGRARKRPPSPLVVSTGTDDASSLPAVARRTHAGLEAARVSQHSWHPDQSDVRRRVCVRQDGRADAHHHPVAITYETARAAKPLEFTTQVVTGAKITVGSGANPVPLFGASAATATVECSSCHNAHNNSLGNFLRKSNSGSAICLSCHIK